jgi:two-component system nitrate/nitrite response regulator NarL
MCSKIRLVILDDHQSIIDGYMLRLNQAQDIEVVAMARFGEQIEPMLREHPSDVLILDVNVPTSADNPNPYPILHLIPKILQRYPDLNVLVISQYNQPALIKAVMDAGACGYILKEDYVTIQDLANVIRAVSRGDIYLSKQAYQQLSKKLPKEISLTPRQQEVLSLCTAFPDADTNELAQRLGVANSTVRNLLSGAYVRLDVRNRAAAIAKARQLGLTTPSPPNIQLSQGSWD